MLVRPAPSVTGSPPGPGILSVALCLAIAAAASAGAERLPTARPVPVGGVPDEGAVTALAVDSRGYLWVGTGAGVSRFDGSLVRTYQVRDGPAVHRNQRHPGNSRW